MFLLTEGTLFFLDLALKTRARDQLPSPRTVVQTWVDGVAAATDDTANGALHAAGASSDSTFGCVFSESTTQSRFTIPKTSDRCAKNCHHGFVLTNSNHEHGVSRPISDGSRCICFFGASLSQCQLEPRRAVKRRLIDLTTANHGRIHIRPSKRVKYEDPSVPCFSSPAGVAMGYLSAVRIAYPQPLLFNDEDYAIEMIKKYSEFIHTDLPVPCNQRWSHSFLSTAILWYSVQKNIWSVPEEELTDALQHIFNVVYPGISYRVTPAGSVFKLTLQRIDEWRSSFGSSALAIMLHFFSTFDNNNDIQAAAELLSTDLRFLQEDPDSAEPTNTFRSPFLLLLLAITHLGDIDSFVDVPGWDTQAMAAGWSGEGVIALASVALERALRFICDGTLDVDQVLGEVPCHRDTSTMMGSSRHSKTPNMFTARDAPAALRFSSANWNNPTAVYRESARKRGATFVSEIFAAARARRRKMTSDANVELGANGSVSGVPDSHGLAD